MISIMEVIKGISGWIEANFDAAPITKDIQEGFPRPCTFVTPAEMSSAKESGLVHDTFRIDIVRFSELSYRGYKSLLKDQKKFAELLTPGYIRVNDSFYIYPDEVEYELDREDMYLVISFSIENYQEISETDTSPNMSTLFIDSEKVYEEEED